MNNVKQIALALANYEDQYGEFPPAFLTDRNGRPVHSWRVLILPFLGEQALFNQFRFDEPWDGPNNRKLADQMPDVYRCPSFFHQKEHDGSATDADQPLTQYVAAVGENTILRPGKSISLESIGIDPSEILLVAEVSSARVHWMSPVDISADEFRSVFKSADEKHNHPGGVNAAACDCSVRFLSNEIDPDRIRFSATKKTENACD